MLRWLRKNQEEAQGVLGRVPEAAAESAPLSSLRRSDGGVAATGSLFGIKSPRRFTYQPPPPYCPVAGSLEDHIRELDGRVGYLGPVARNKVVRALEMATGMLGKGWTERQIAENVTVAAIVADLQMDCDTVCAAVLKGCVGGIEGMDEEMVGGEVGWDVVQILKMKTKIEDVVNLVKHEITPSEESYATLRELVFFSVNDHRAISLQLASAVVVTRGLGSLKDDESENLLAEKALQFYAPLAHQLGIWFIQSELEELAFMYLHPKEYEEIRKLVGMRLKESHDLLHVHKEQIEKAIRSSPAVVRNARSIRLKGRIKGIYSIYRKMKRSRKDINEIYDLLALRVVVQPRGGREQAESQICYEILDAIKQEFEIIEGRYKDYIANPKPNGYMSLHATICPGPTQAPIEIQIRTERMHHVAEFGAAAHWIYQEDARRSLSISSDDEDDGDGSEGKHRRIEPFVDLSIAREEFDLPPPVSGGEMQIAQSRRKGYVRYVNAAIRGSMVIVRSCGKLVKMAAGATLMDLALGMGLGVRSLRMLPVVNGRVAPLSQTLEMNDAVHFVPSWK